MRNDTLRFQSDDKSLDHVVEVRNFFQNPALRYDVIPQHWSQPDKMKHESYILHTPLIPISEKPVN